MIFIFGGAYQGKLEFAQEKFNIRDEEIYTLDDKKTEIQDVDCKVVDKIENLCWALNHEGIEARDYLEKKKEYLKDKIVISRDVSQGLVPMDREERDYREMMGRMMIYLSKEADEVYRVFAGLGQKIK